MAAPLETGQTETIATKVDYSKVSQLDNYAQVLVKQPVRASELFMEMCCGCEMQNLYTIIGVDEKSKSNEKLFTLKEDSNCCLRQWYELHFFFMVLLLFYCILCYIVVVQIVH